MQIPDPSMHSNEPENENQSLENQSELNTEMPENQEESTEMAQDEVTASAPAEAQEISLDEVEKTEEIQAENFESELEIAIEEEIKVEIAPEPVQEELIVVQETEPVVAVLEEADEEEVQEEADLELEEHIAWNELSREELLEQVNRCIEVPASSDSLNKVRAIKQAYRSFREDDIRTKRERYLENGGVPEDFEIQRDELDDSLDAAFKKFNELRNKIREQKEKELENNLAKKQAILEELKLLPQQANNISESFQKLQDLQNRWRETGQVPMGMADELWKNYQHHTDNFFSLIKINNELRELDQKKNLEMKTALCEKAEALILEDSIKASLDAYKVLQDQWKEIGYVSKDQSEVIWDRFKAAGDKLFDRRREYVQSQEEHYGKNLEVKKLIIQKTNDIIAKEPFETHNQWQEASEAFNALMEEWKQAGFASRKDNEAVWQEFKSIRDEFYNRKEAFYKELRESQNQNYKVKVDLCMEAESLRESTDWKKTGDRLRQLQEDWKKSGPVAKKYSEKLWKRFRTACDEFFETRSKHFEGMSGEQDENLKKKQDLIDRIVAFVHAEDGNETFEALKAFQQEWMQIGHVPMKAKEKIQKAYRTAIDDQFSKFKEMSAAARRDVFKAQVQSVASDKGGKDKLQHQKNVVQDKIRRLQGDVQTLENNIGFLANSKSKAADDMRRDIERKIGKAKEEIGQLMDQMRILRDN